MRSCALSTLATACSLATRRSVLLEVNVVWLKWVHTLFYIGHTVVDPLQGFLEGVRDHYAVFL